MSQRPLFVLLTLIAGIAGVPAIADAQVGMRPQAQPKFEWYAADYGRPAPPPFVLPQEPGLDAACGAKPSRAQCMDPAYWSGNACGKLPAADAKKKSLENYCTWVFQKAWTETAKPQRATALPVPPMPNTVYPAMPAARPNNNSKKVEPQSIPARPTTRRSNRRGATPTPPKAGAPLTTAKFNPGSITTTNGTFASMMAPDIVNRSGRVRTQMDLLTDNRVQNTTNIGFVNTTNAIIMTRPPFLTTPGKGVSTCQEFAFKHWGTWSNFAYAANALGANDRAVYQIAMDPTSPVFLNKAMTQYENAAAPTPKQLADVPGTKTIPMNAFYAVDPAPILNSDLNKGMTTAGQKTAITAAWQRAKNTQFVSPTSDGSPLAAHKAAKTALETRWGNPVDEEMEDIVKRKSMYLDLVGQRTELMFIMRCAHPTDPCFVCAAPPNPGAQQAPAGISKILERATGMTRINPWETNVLFHTGTPADRYESLLGFMGAPQVNVQLQNDVRTNINVGGVVSGGFRKEKANPFLDNAQVGAAKPAPGTGVGRVVQVTGNPCLDELLKKRPGAEAALGNTEKDMIRLLANEMSFGDRGCLKDPGGNQTNICDWSYSDFAGMAKSLFSKSQEADLAECNTKVFNNARAPRVVATDGPMPVNPKLSTIAGEPQQQLLVWPCVRRANFTGSAADAEKFLRLNEFTNTGQTCEAKRQTQYVADLQKAYAEYFKDLDWEPMTGKVSDTQSDEASIPGALGAYFAYDGSWNIRRTSSVGGETLKGCEFKGTGKALIRAGIDFFGSNIELFKSDATLSAESNPGKLSYYGYWRDILANDKKVIGDVSNKTLSTNYGAGIPIAILGGDEYSFYTTIGPFNVRITFGFGAYAGVIFGANAKSGNNCADLNKPSGFVLKAQTVPWASASAYADAGLDYGVASAGVRVDLTLVSLAVPMGIDINNTGANWNFDNGGQVNVGLLSGSLSGYVEAGVPPLEVSFSATLMEWDGFRARIPGWGLDRQAPNEAMRILLAEGVATGEAKCKCKAGLGFCCSSKEQVGNNSCPSGNCPNGSPEHRAIDGKNYLCRLNQDDASKIGCFNPAGVNAVNLIQSQPGTP